MTTPSQDTLLALLKYDAETGTLIWLARPRSMFAEDGQFKTWNKKNAGKEAGSIDCHGYRKITIGRRSFRAHRIIFKMMTGRDAALVDHINQDRTDNRWSNLRETTKQGNAQNMKLLATNKSGVQGVWWNAKDNRWRAQIYSKGIIYLGQFKNIDDAREARKAAETALGFSPLHGEMQK